MRHILAYSGIALIVVGVGATTVGLLIGEFFDFTVPLLLSGIACLFINGMDLLESLLRELRGLRSELKEG